MKNIDIAFTGLSASGKTTVALFLQGKETYFNINEKNEKRLKEIGILKKIITSTTRLPRLEEKDKIDYYFLSNKNFKEKIKNNSFVEYSNVFGNLYGLTREELNRTSNCNRILIVDPQGIRKIKQINNNIKTIYFDISLENSFKRMKNFRKDDEIQIKERMKEYKYFLEIKNECDFVIDGNKEINEVIEEILDIIEKLIKK